jgi:hypothetical protein
VSYTVDLFGHMYEIFSERCADVNASKLEDIMFNLVFILGAAVEDPFLITVTFLPKGLVLRILDEISEQIFLLVF